MLEPHQHFRVYCKHHRDYEKHDITINQYGRERENDRAIAGRDHIFEFCTGACDTTGKLIYAGDRVRVTCVTSKKSWETIVVWSKKKLAYVFREELPEDKRWNLEWNFNDTDYESKPFTFTIIGNSNKGK